MKSNCVLFIRKNRIISPHHFLPSYLIRKAFECIYTLLKWWQFTFKFRSVRIQCKLEIVFIVLQSVQFINHRCRILRPKDNAINNSRVQVDPADHIRIIRIRYQNIPFFYPVEKPLRIKSRYIRPATGTDDHLPTSLFVGRWNHVIFFNEFVIYPLGVVKMSHTCTIFIKVLASEFFQFQIVFSILSEFPLFTSVQRAIQHLGLQQTPFVCQRLI